MPRLPAPFDPEPDETPGAGTATVLEEAPEPLLELPGREHHVLLTGATGFVGQQLLPRLVHRGHRVRALSRRPPEDRAPGFPDQVEWYRVDLLAEADLQGIVEECDRVVHLAGSSDPSGRETDPSLDVEGTRILVDEAVRAAVERFVYVSALGAGKARSVFCRSKAAAERVVLGAAVEPVVFRPAVIYGPGDYFTSRLRSVIDRYGAVPLLGRSDFRLQPLAVEDVVEALCQAVERPAFGERVYQLGGPSALPFDEIVRAVAGAMGATARVVEIPAVLDRLLGPLTGLLGWVAPIRAAEVEWLRAQGPLDAGEHALREVFRLEPLPFREVLSDYF